MGLPEMSPRVRQGISGSEYQRGDPVVFCWGSPKEPNHPHHITAADAHAAVISVA